MADQAPPPHQGGGGPPTAAADASTRTPPASSSASTSTNTIPIDDPSSSGSRLSKRPSILQVNSGALSSDVAVVRSSRSRGNSLLAPPSTYSSGDDLASSSTSSLVDRASNSSNSGDQSRTNRLPFSRRKTGPSGSISGSPNTSTAGTFLTRFLGSFRGASTEQQQQQQRGETGTSQMRPNFPRSLSNPLQPRGLAIDDDGPVPPSPSYGLAGVPGSLPSTRHHPNASTTSSAQGSSSGQSLPTVENIPPESSGSGKQRFRPSFGRRASTGTPKASPSHSPMASPALSDLPRPSPGSPATLRGRERDPMEIAAAMASRSGVHSGQDGSRSARRGSAVSQLTLLADQTPHLAGSGAFNPLGPIVEPDASGSAPPLERPLELVATLIPTALLMLGQLGPSHLFSPPVSLPAFADLFQPYAASSAHLSSSASRTTEVPYLASDRASIASSVTSTNSSHGTSGLFSPLPAHLVPSHSHELYAPSTVSVPVVSAAAIWRLFCGLEWVSEAGQNGATASRRPAQVRRHDNEDAGAVTSPPPAEDEDVLPSFDFPSMLQGVADVLSAAAAGKGVEVVIGQVGQGKPPSPMSTPPLADDQGGVRRGAETAAGSQASSPPANGLPLPSTATGGKVTESAELLVRGDERAWSIALIWVLHEIMASATTGASIDVRFQATLASSPPKDLSPIVEQGIEDSQHTLQPPQPGVENKWWIVLLEIVHILGPAQQPDSFASNPSLPSPTFDSAPARSLFAHPLLKLKLKEGALNDPISRSWSIESLVQSAKAPVASTRDDEPSFLGYRRGSGDAVASSGQEPTVEELKRFAETALKGLRVALHASEYGPFAKHLTSYLAGWGMDVSHIPLDNDDAASTRGGRPRAESSDSSHGHGEPTNSPFMTLGVSDGSAFGGSGLGTDPTSNLIIIDDDVTTLRRLLHTLRLPPLHYQPTLLAKRPQLATRRTRSTPHVRQVHQQPPTLATWVIVHFASLSHFKTIKEVVQDALANSRSPTLPEVLVIPKPAGPRRIITSLWTALRRPAVDPSLAPIATSPSSPGVQYWTPKLSPAVGRDENAFELQSDRGEGTVASSNASIRVRTPPTSGIPPPMPTGHPPSPLGTISDDQVSYFSGVAETLDGTSPSEGIVLQSPNGRPAIFFQPSTRRLTGGKDKGARVEREREASGGSSIRVRGSDSANSPKDGIESQLSSPPSVRAAPVATPHEIGLGHPRRSSSGGSSTSPNTESPHLVPIGTPALTLDSFILSAKSRASGEREPEPAIEPPIVSRPSDALKRQGSSASLSSRARLASASSPPAVTGTGGSSPRVGPVGAGGAAARRMVSGTAATPPMSPSPGNPIAGLTAKASASAPTTPPSFYPSSSRRGTISSAPKNRRRPSRKVTLPAVPPINVLIVEDNPINQMILSTFMKKKGIKYAVAKDGEEAVQKWKAGSFHLVLMDIQLPVKDGIEATREIREMERANNIGTFITTPITDIVSPVSSGSNSLPSSSQASPHLTSPVSPLLLSMPVIIVALTASSLQADRVNALAAGCNDFLTKPVSLVWLEKKLREWGSMAYLSGFSAFPGDPSSSSSRTSTTPTPRITPTSASNKAFTAGMNSKAAVISSHLHIDPKHLHSGASSQVGGGTKLTTMTIEEASPVERRLPVNGNVPTPTEPLATSPADPANPKLTIQAPTPEVDHSSETATARGASASIASPNIPSTITELSPPSPPSEPAGDDQGPVAPVVNDQSITMVDEKLRNLAAAESSSSTAGDEPPIVVPSVLSSKRSGPSPLAQSSTVSPDGHITHERASNQLDEVVAEGARLVEVGQSRTNSSAARSDSFGQVFSDSGM